MTIQSIEPITHFGGEFFFLSNFYRCDVHYVDCYEDLCTYPSVEHAFQAAKTLDKNRRWEISQAYSPGEAKRMGRRLTLRPDWEPARLPIMQVLVDYKFITHLDLGFRLLETGSRKLIEGNTWGDTFWGCVLTSDGQREGQNHLGKILMATRNRLREGQ